MPELTSRFSSIEGLSGWAKANPIGAAEFITQRTAAGDNLKDLKASGILADIAIAEPAWTSEWLMALPDTSLQKEAAETLGANWITFDPEAAERWMASLPEGPVREAAKAGIARRDEGRVD